MNNQPESPFIFSRLFFSQPLDPSRVQAFLARLASDSRRQLVVLETRASSSGIVHLIGCWAEYIHEVRRIVSDLIPGTVMIGLDSYHRKAMLTTGTVKFAPAELPLSVSEPEQITRAIYSALARPLKDDDEIVVQVMLGSGVAPRQTPPKIPNPNGMSIWQALTRGTSEAPAEVRSKVRDRAREYALDCSIRIGVNADTESKRRRMGLSVLAGIRLSAGAGVKIELRQDDPTSFNAPRTPRWYASRLTVSELVPLASLPIGSEQLPGMPPAHPKPLRAESRVPDGPITLADSLVPGDHRRLGLTLPASLHHCASMGPTGAGKTTMLERAMESVICAGCGVLIMEPKDQTSASLLPRIPRERWPDIYEINAADQHPNGINILDPGDGDNDVHADTILAVIDKLFNDLGPRTSDILNGSIRTLIRTHTPESPHTILDLPKLLTDASFRRSLIGKVQDDLALAGFWAWYESLKPAQQLNVIAPTMNRIRQLLLRPALVKILGQRKPAFRLGELFRANKIVIVPLNEALIGPQTANLLGSLVAAIAWKATQERAAIPEAQRRPGFVFIDEADRFMNGTLTVSLADALDRSRSLGISWWLSVQRWEQLPKAVKSAVKTNARNKIIFRLEDDDDARVIAKLAPELQPIDFMSLDKYEVYMRLVVDGVTTGWALAKTLPPNPPLATLEEVRREAKRHHPVVAFDHEHMVDLTEPVSSEKPPPVMPSGVIGRKPRRPT